MSDLKSLLRMASMWASLRRASRYKAQPQHPISRTGSTNAETQAPREPSRGSVARTKRIVPYLKLKLDSCQPHTPNCPRSLTEYATDSSSGGEEPGNSQSENRPSDRIGSAGGCLLILPPIVSSAISLTVQSQLVTNFLLNFRQ